MSGSLPKLEYYLINAFDTGKPGSGNQAAVVLFPTTLDPRAEDDAFLLRTAQDFGFAETAYLVPLDPNSGRWGLRWFTVEVEVPICGHATLAAAKVVLSLHEELSEITFETRFWGHLIVKRVNTVTPNSLEIQISLSTLPKETLQSISENGQKLTEDLGGPLAEALQIQKDQVVGVGEFKFVDKSLIVELSPDVDLKSVQVDPKALVPYSPDMTIVTQMIPAESTSGVLRTHTRVFCEDNEDPVTGSAHAFITGYYLLTSVSKRIPTNILNGQAVESVKIDGRQLSRRGGKLGLEMASDGKVRLTGVAIEWGRGSLTVQE